MVLGSSDSLEKRGQLLPLCLEEPPLGFQEVPNTAGRISWLGFGQDSIGCGNWLLLPNARVNFQCLIQCSCVGCRDSGMFRAAGNGLILLPAQCLGLVLDLFMVRWIRPERVWTQGMASADRG